MTRRRNEFTKETKRQAFTRSGGRCESSLVPSLTNIGCNRELRQGDINYDHIQADGTGGDNSLSNCAVLCRACHSIKTRAHDVPAIAQDKRVRDLARGIRNAPSLPGSRQDPFKIKVSGRQVVERASGEPWRPGR